MKALKTPGRKNRQFSSQPDLEEDLVEGDLDDDEYDYYSKYDDMGRTPPRTRMQQNRKWKDNRKLMTEAE